MRLLPFAICLLPLVTLAAEVKELPLDESWSVIPETADPTKVVPVPVEPEKPKELTPAQLEQKARTPATTGLSAPPVGVASVPAGAVNQPPVAEVRTAAPVEPPKPEDWNDVSLYGAKALKRGTFAVGGFAGFPTLNVRGRYGVGDGLDVGIGFESFYGMMNEPQLQLRYQLTSGDVEVALAVDGSFAHFVLKPQADPVGARWITGHRNWNMATGFILSKRASAPTLPRLFLDVRALIAFDTQPYQRTPLGGVPSQVQLAWNVPVRMGGEIPISPRSSFVVDLGFDIHGRDGDSVFMPVLSVGAVVGF
jgi:hypothetical protein